MQAQVRTSGLVLCLLTQLQFQLAQGIDDARLELRRRLDVVSGAHLGHAPQLVDYATESWTTGSPELSSQVFSIAQTLSQFGIQLAIVPAAVSARTIIRAALTAAPGIRSVLLISLLTLL